MASDPDDVGPIEVGPIEVGPIEVGPIEVTPAATDDELAAIVAAYEELWPELLPAEPEPDATPAWRFSGRWWLASPGRRLRSSSVR